MILVRFLLILPLGMYCISIDKNVSVDYTDDSRSTLVTFGPPQQKDPIILKFLLSENGNKNGIELFQANYIDVELGSSVKFVFDQHMDFSTYKIGLEDRNEIKKYRLVYGFSFQKNFDQAPAGNQVAFDPDSSLKGGKFVPQKLTLHLSFMSPDMVTSGWSSLTITPKEKFLSMEIGCGKFDESSRKVLFEKEKILVNKSSNLFVNKILGQFIFGSGATPGPSKEDAEKNYKMFFASQNFNEKKKIFFLNLIVSVSNESFASLLAPTVTDKIQAMANSSKQYHLSIEPKVDRIV